VKLEDVIDVDKEALFFGSHLLDPRFLQEWLLKVLFCHGKKKEDQMRRSRRENREEKIEKRREEDEREEKDLASRTQ